MFSWSAWAFAHLRHYQREVLADCLWSLKQHNWTMILYLTGKLVPQSFKLEEIRVLEWPAWKSDLNLIENLWTTLQTAVVQCHPTNLDELCHFAVEEWSRIFSKICTNLIQGYWKGLNGVKVTKGCTSQHWMEAYACIFMKLKKSQL